METDQKTPQEAEREFVERTNKRENRGKESSGSNRNEAKIKPRGFSVSMILLIMMVIAEAEAQPQGNVLDAGFGVVYKYRGKIHSNLDRMQIFLAFPQQNFTQLFREIRANWTQVDPCKERGFLEWHELLKNIVSTSSPYDRSFWSRRVAIVDEMCQSFKKRKSQILDEARYIEGRLENAYPREIYTLFPGWNPEEAGPISHPGRSGRKKRGFGLFTGLKTLFEGGKLLFDVLNYRRAGRAMEMYRKLKGEMDGNIRRIDREFAMLKKDLGVFRKWVIRETGEIQKQVANISALVSEGRKRSDHSDAVVRTHLLVENGLDSLENYQRQFIRRAEEEYRRFVRGLAETCSGRLSTDLVNATQLGELIEESLFELRKLNPEFELVMRSLSEFYELKVVSVYAEEETGLLLVSFPVFIQQLRNTPFDLYEIETVDVPIEDKNPGANSYSRVQIEKAFIAANDKHYFQLTEAELMGCHKSRDQYYCEDRFLMKHKSKYTCASAIFFRLGPEEVKELCEFEYSFNKTVTPAILDGGDQIVLANLPGEKYLQCRRDTGSIPLPSEHASYMVIDKGTLCECDLEVELLTLRNTLSSCNGSETRTTVKYILNEAFRLYEPEMLSAELLSGEYKIHGLRDWPQTFNIELKRVVDPVEFNDPETLRELVHFWKNYDITVEAQESIKREVREKGFWGTKLAGILGVLGLLASIGVGLALLYLCAKHRILYAAAPLALPQTEALADYSNIHCPTHWTVWFFMCTSLIGLVFFLYRVYRKRVLCRGRKYNDKGVVKLIVADEERYVAVPLATVYGPVHKFSTVSPMAEVDMRCETALFGFSVAILIDWREFKLMRGEQPLHLPSRVSVPMWEAWRVTKMFRSNKKPLLSCYLKQRGYRYSIPLELTPPKGNKLYPTLEDIERAQENRTVYTHLISTIPSGQVEKEEM